MYTFLDTLLILVTVYIAFSSAYNLMLAASYFLTKEPLPDDHGEINRFVLIVPAHNEELLIGNTCENLKTIDYPKDAYDIIIVADNCTDSTVDICKGYSLKVLSRNDPLKGGKGYAIEWALEMISLDKYDSVLILDADTTVEPAILSELNAMLNEGEQVIQCYIKVPNKDESWFTQLIYLSRTINDQLYHYAKYKLGLSSYLMGTGMCFKAAILKEHRWSAFSLSEDWEYYAHLIKHGIRVGFSTRAKVLQQESRSLHQATSQRLRWASGRFYVVKSLGFKLFAQGVIKKNLMMMDASLALIFPNWSLLINLILISAVLSIMMPASSLHQHIMYLDIALLGMQGIILAAGMYLCGDYLALLKAIIMAPVFLVWKMMIDILCITGLYRGKKWIRTKRHIPGIK